MLEALSKDKTADHGLQHH